MAARARFLKDSGGFDGRLNGEEVIAPEGSLNHNETLVSDEVEPSVEALEKALAPTPSIPIPPPFRNH